MLQTNQTIKSTKAVNPYAAEVIKRRIRDLNDEFRRNPFLGPDRFMLTQGVCALSDSDRRTVIERVLGFTNFTEGNNPHGEHDFGALDLNGTKIFWKIDYYTPDLKHGSPDPSDPSITCRVLTVMLASEY